MEHFEYDHGIEELLQKPEWKPVLMKLLSSEYAIIASLEGSEMKLIGHSYELN